jgi:hypothetical protein
MNTEPPSPTLLEQLKESATQIVKKGGDIRAEISKLVSGAAGKFYAARDGLVDLGKAVADGAAAGVQQVAPSGSESSLRAVADGIADGFAKSAQAVRLTLEESGTKGAQFAREDLDKILKDFRQLGDTALEITGRLARGCGGQLSSQLKTFFEHTKTTLQGLRAPLESVVNAARKDPVGLGKDTLHAGAAATREAAGAFFSEIGRHLQSAGERMRQPGSGGGNAT